MTDMTMDINLVLFYAPSTYFILKYKRSILVENLFWYLVLCNKIRNRNIVQTNDALYLSEINAMNVTNLD